MQPNGAVHSSSASMKHLSKVVWFEGMYLGPQHFQTQRLSFEDLIHFTSSNLWFEPHGFSGCELDSEALRNGTVALVHARGIFQDGLVFNVPESDSPPPVRLLEAFFSPTRGAPKVILRVSLDRETDMRCALR